MPKTIGNVELHSHPLLVDIFFSSVSNSTELGIVLHFSEIKYDLMLHIHVLHVTVKMLS
jgi:hypothetical protein